MSIVSVDIIPAVADVLTLLGDLTTFTRVTQGAYDTTTGALAAGTTTTYSCRCVSDKFNTQELANGTALAGDMKYLVLPTGGYVPAVNDTASVNGIIYRVMNVINDNLQGQTYLFTLTLRV